ncbi:MAG: DUF2461 domain-containing protein [Alphaproteobacteria bacterium]
MDHLTPASLEFLDALAANNTRDWFNANKPSFVVARQEFENLVGQLIFEITRFDSQVAGLEPKRCVFRIYRDTRFARDKRPYKTNFGAHMVAGGRGAERGRAGYYLNIAPGDCFLAGGAHLPPAEWMGRIRRAISENASTLRGIIAHADFKKYFGEIEGEKLKTAPKGFAKDHGDIDLLRYKSLLAVHRFDDQRVLEPGFSAYAGKVFGAMHPFGSFLNQQRVP